MAAKWKKLEYEYCKSFLSNTSDEIRSLGNNMDKLDAIKFSSTLAQSDVSLRIPTTIIVSDLISEPMMRLLENLHGN
jgi:hypothetical protein